MDFILSQSQQELIASCRNFAQTEIAPHVAALEQDLARRQALLVAMARKGWFQLAAERSDTVGYVLALAEIAKADAGIAVAMAVTNMVAEALVLYGTDHQKQHYLPLIRSGECVPAAFAITEPQAGSDVKKIETVAIKNSRGYILKGEKRFITNADIAGVTVVMAKMEGTDQISAFLVDRNTPGFLVTKKENKVGLLTANLVALRFDDCVIPKENLLGKEGQGLVIALSSLDRGRIGIAAQSLGIAQAAYTTALEYAKERVQFGKPIAEQEVIAFKLADMHTRVSASQALLLKAAIYRDQGMPVTLAAAEAKLFCSEACNWIAAEALQIHGGCGYIKDYPIEKYWRDARVTTIYEGTSEIQRLVISRHILNT